MTANRALFSCCSNSTPNVFGTKGHVSVQHFPFSFLRRFLNFWGYRPSLRHALLRSFRHSDGLCCSPTPAVCMGLTETIVGRKSSDGPSAQCPTRCVVPQLRHHSADQLPVPATTRVLRGCQRPMPGLPSVRAAFCSLPFELLRPPI